MKIIKNKFILSSFFIALMLVGIVSFGTNTVSAFTVSEDIYEENDDFWSANQTGPGFYPNLCQGDDDWFNISIGVDEIIKVSLEFDGYQNDIDLQLLDNSQMILDSSYGVDNYESVAWISYVPQSVYIRIYGADNSEAYNMTIEIIPKGAYDDEYEPNDEFTSASEIYPDFYHNLVNNDMDIYKIYLDQEVSIDIYNTSYLWVQLFDDMYMLLADFTNEGSYLTLDWETHHSGDYYIVVNGSALGDFYDMDIWLTGPMDDWAEPNDFLGESCELGFGYHDGLVQSDDDWYKVWLYPNDPLEINLFYDTVYTWMNLELYDEYENHLASSNMDGDHLHLSWTNWDYNQYVYIKITGNNNGDWYHIGLDLTMGDDWAEENDYFYEAQHLNLGYHDELVQNDDDWYEVWLEPNDPLEINLFYDTEYSWMNLELYNENEAFLTSGTNEEGHLILSWTNDDDYGRSFYIKITGNNNGDWYNLDLIIGDDGDNSGDDKNNNDPFADFDIPGFPIEIVGVSFIISTFAVIFFVKKKKQ